MPIYSETISDDQLLALVSEKAREVVLIGCGACMNESLAYKYNVPITENLNSEMPAPSATINELNKIKKVLKANGRNIRIVYFNDINGFLCMRDANHDDYPIKLCEKPDIIMTLCCGAGYDAIKDLFPDIRVVKITVQKALLFYGFNDEDEIRMICKEKSALMPLLSSSRKEV